MRSSRLKILLLGALAGAAGFGLIRSFVPPSPRMGLGLQSYTKGTAVVTLTNLSRFTLLYHVKVDRKTAEGWPKHQDCIPLGVQSEGSLGAGEATNLTVRVVDYVQAYPWRISVFCLRSPSITDQIRCGTSDLLLRVHWTKLARQLWAGPRIVQISGPQKEQ